jgi:hypothetical protein
MIGQRVGYLRVSSLDQNVFVKEDLTFTGEDSPTSNLFSHESCQYSLAAVDTTAALAKFRD